LQSGLSWPAQGVLPGTRASSSKAVTFAVGRRPDVL
jgi:hypothetical protein